MIQLMAYDRMIIVRWWQFTVQLEIKVLTVKYHTRNRTMYYKRLLPNSRVEEGREKCIVSQHDRMSKPFKKHRNSNLKNHLVFISFPQLYATQH